MGFSLGHWIVSQRQINESHMIMFCWISVHIHATFFSDHPQHNQILVLLTVKTSKLPTHTVHLQLVVFILVLLDPALQTCLSLRHPRGTPMMTCTGSHDSRYLQVHCQLNQNQEEVLNYTEYATVTAVYNRIQL